MTQKIVSLMVVMTLAGATMATEYTCPSPDTVRCVPAQTTNGNWTANGGQMTGNSFAANNQCANVIQLTPSSSRLFCCYVKCGVFIQDVSHGHCSKTDQSHFSCR